MFFFDAPPPQPLAAIVKIIPQKDLSYRELPCTDQDQSKIAELVTFIAENNYATLLWREPHVRHLGAQINSVFPLKFLAFAIKHVKPQLKMIFEDTLKRNGFMTGKDGLSVNLDREAQKGTLQQYIHSFSEDVGVSPVFLDPYFTARDWEGLVSSLIY
ncbi:MAG TPA: hypothetical protein VJK48_07135 [Chlamydiales bacterium]|nr:MAG: hypothetical protein A3F67_08275 [Verrucomicrobia bacterium RIFCSPHIGHO2_12_FULL_41_10]HLB53463.1 hypothetical protein [Chlamydiales bacterium]